MFSVCLSTGGGPYLGLDRGAPPRPGTGQGGTPPHRTGGTPPSLEQHERYGVGGTPLAVTLEVFLV